MTICSRSLRKKAHVLYPRIAKLAATSNDAQIDGVVKVKVSGIPGVKNGNLRPVADVNGYQRFLKHLPQELLDDKKDVLLVIGKRLDPGFSLSCTSVHTSVSLSEEASAGQKVSMPMV